MRELTPSSGVRATDRRATRRYFLFTPDEGGEIEQAFWYTLGHNANKHGIEIHCDPALARWTAGDRRVRFPHGTWWMRVHHDARCLPPP